MSVDLSQRVCVITGAARGIGRAVAEGFAQRGATVVATDADMPECAGAAEQRIWDVTDPQQAEDTVRDVVARFGRLDVMVANAGIFPHQKWDEVTPELVHKILSVNLEGTWHAAHAAAEAMKKNEYGKIVTVSSIQIARGPATQIPYAASKGGVLAMTRSLARAVGKHGIRVNSVMPGAVWSEGTIGDRTQEELDAVIAQWSHNQCIDNALWPKDLEPTFAFLSSSESDAITGQVVCVDYGSIHW